MKRFGWIAIFSFVFCFPLFGQVEKGNIYGKIVDTEGNPLPGVSVTLTGSLTAPITATTSEAGLFRFISLSPARDYRLKAELTGFKPAVQENIIVVIGANVNLTLTMEVGGLEKEITVTASTPLVDSKKTTVALNVTKDILQSLPIARDPWVIIQMAPSVIVDRENVGENESVHQSLFTVKGSPRESNSYQMDGINISMPASAGATSFHLDVDSFEEMNITVGGSDVTVQTGGVGINLVTKRGGNKVSLAGRYYFTDQNFQADNLSDALMKQGVKGINAIRRNREYGFNFGVPIIKEKAWFWASYGEQDLQTTTIFGDADDARLTYIAAKFNLQLLPQNRFEAYLNLSDKNVYGAGQTTDKPGGLILFQGPGQPHGWGIPVVKFQDEHMFGDKLFVSLKYAWMDFAAGHAPTMDPNLTNLSVWDVAGQRWFGSFSWWDNRDCFRNEYNASASYFNDRLLGASHEMKVGFVYETRKRFQLSGVYNGNAFVRRNYNTPVVDFTGDGQPDIPTDPNFKFFQYQRGAYNAQSVTAYAGYFSDTITFGRFNVILGLRYDHQIPIGDAFSIPAVDRSAAVWGRDVNARTTDVLDKLLPGIEVPKATAKNPDGSNYFWGVFSPRLGLTWDLSGNGKTIAKLSLASYGDYMSQGEAIRLKPGGGSGYMNFWWRDNGDAVLDFTELYWHTIKTYGLYRAFDDAGNFTGNLTDAAGTFWGGFDFQNPSKLIPPYQTVDSNAGSSRTLEAILTLERELLPDFAVSVNATYRKYDHFSWTLAYFPDTGVFANQDWYVSAGNPPADIPGIGDTKEAKNYEWYYTSAEGTAYTPYSWTKRRPEYYRDFMGLDFIATKRLSNRWMLNASFTWQTQKDHWGTQGYLNPTNKWAYDGQPFAFFLGGGSGKNNQYIFTRWMFKVGGLYQLPYGVNLGFNFLAREGWVIRESFRIFDYTLPNPKSNSATLDMTPFGSDRLPNNYILNGRIEKMLAVGEGKFYLMLDLFNVFNSATINRREQKYYGTYYKYANSAQNRFVADPNYYMVNEILNPRVLRIGVRFEF
jgi:hypothetical protein